MGGRVRDWALAGWATLTVTLLTLVAVVEFRPAGGAGDWAWGVGLMAFPVAAALLLSSGRSGPHIGPTVASANARSSGPGPNSQASMMGFGRSPVKVRRIPTPQVVPRSRPCEPKPATPDRL